MSYDINFWKQTRPLEISAQEIYERLSRGEQEIDGLAELPVDQIKQRLKEAFPDYDPQDPFPLIQTEHGSIEVLHSRQSFRFDLRGETEEVHNRLVEIMADFGCPMYDPQRGQRYDAEGGTAVGTPPRFEDTTEEQRQQIEALKQQMLKNIQRGGRRSGCGTSAAAFVFFCAALAAVWRLLA